MSKFGRITGVIVVLGGVVLLGYLFLPKRLQTQSNDGALKVAATIFPLADIVRQVGGDGVEVTLIIPPGVTEHSNTLTPQQLQALQKAQVIFSVGHGLDDALVERVQDTVGNIPGVQVDRNIELQPFETELEHAEEGHDHDEDFDPHYWLSVPNAMEIAETVYEELAELNPEEQSMYQQNLERYVGQLNGLEQELQAKAQTAQRKEFIAMHNAWGYFAQQYGFKLVATYEPVEGKQPSLADLNRLREVIERYGLKNFYAEPQKATSAVTNFMQREFGLTVQMLDPVGGITPNNSYIDLMRSNVEAIAG